MSVICLFFHVPTVIARAPGPTSGGGSRSQEEGRKGRSSLGQTWVSSTGCWGKHPQPRRSAQQAKRKAQLKVTSIRSSNQRRFVLWSQLQRRGWNRLLLRKKNKTNQVAIIHPEGHTNLRPRNTKNQENGTCLRPRNTTLTWSVGSIYRYAGTAHSKCRSTGSACPVAIGHRDSIQQEMLLAWPWEGPTWHPWQNPC